jgi:hypothetical protein
MRIPSEILGKPVVGIGFRAFVEGGWVPEKLRITEVYIPEGVVSIGDEAFRECTELKIVSLPSSLTHIGAHAFIDSWQLANITIPGNVTHIRDGAFAHTSLKSLTIPNSVISVGDQAFDSITNFKATYKGKTYSSFETTIPADDDAGTPETTYHKMPDAFYAAINGR